MKLSFKNLKSWKWAAGALALLALIAMDMAYQSTQTVVGGSFRADSLFNAYPKAPATTVAIVASDNDPLLASPIAVTSSALTQVQIEDMVRAAINMVGGITKFVKPGDTVIIKPNIVAASTTTPTGENTDARVVKAIMKIIEDAYDSYGPDSCMIYVGEGSARSIATFGGTLFGNTEYNINTLRADGYLSSIKPSTFDILDLNDGTTGTNCVYQQTKASLAYPQGGKYWIHKFLVNPRIKFINVPVLKMHQPGITNALKNQIGIAAGAYYGYNKMANGAVGNYELFHHDFQNAGGQYKTWQDEEITDLCSCIDTFDLNVIDALVCLENTKSSTADDVRLNTIIVGKDPVAVDHVCTKIIGSNPDDIDHITLAHKIGLGTNDPDSITIAAGSDPISRYTHRFTRGETQSKYGQGNRVWLVSPAYTYTTMANNYIASEASLNPSKGSSPWSPPYFFFDDRIDLASFHNPTGDVVTYCFTNVYSPTATTGSELWLNYEEDIMVYLNGSLVWNYTGSRVGAEVIGSSKTTVNLLAGENTLLVKVLDTDQLCYDFSLNICEPGTNGNRVPGIQFYIKNYNEPAALNPTPTLTDPANRTQTRQLGTAIDPIAFTWGGGATSVNISGLPAGITASIVGKTVTLSGTASTAGSATYTITTVGGAGAPIVRTGIINTVVCSSLQNLMISNLASTGNYRLALYDFATGLTEIKTLATGTFLLGDTKFLFPTTGLSSGSYTYKLLNGATTVKTGTVVIP